jgi:hypothetical protein
MRLDGLDAGLEAWIVVRGAPTASTDLGVRVDGHDLETLHFTASETWVEKSVEVPADRVARAMSFELRNLGSQEFVDYHVWVAQ